MLKVPNNWIAAAATLLLIPAFSQAVGADSDPLVSRYISMAIQGDLSGAETLFEEGLQDEFSTTSLREQFHSRFYVDEYTGRPADGDSFLDGVARTYREYWRQALLDNSRHPVFEARLKASLSRLLLKHRSVESSGTDVFSKLEGELDALGVGYLESPAPLLRDLFLWRSQDSANYTVQLTDRRIELTVFFMDDFVLQGWKEFASLGLSTTTGWVEADNLYCIAWAYDINSENFEISYLKHEARHLLDLEQYPDMDSTELEYRAKLTELAFANLTMRRILNDFAEKAEENPQSPHAMANWRVLRDVYWHLHGTEMPTAYTSWDYVNTGKVNRVARRLLKTSSDSHSIN